MSAPKKDDQVTVDPITTAVGCLGSKGLIAVGTRLKELPIEQFSDNWMKLVTKTDQNKLRSYRTQQALLKKADEGPTIDDALEANQELRDALKSTNGKLGALQQKLEAMQAQIDDLKKSKPKSDAAAQKTAPPLNQQVMAERKSPRNDPPFLNSSKVRRIVRRVGIAPALLLWCIWWK